MKNLNTALLVLSCDKYADAWSPFFQFFQKYWSNCSFPVYLGTNQKNFEWKGVTTIHSNKKTTWSDELYTILEQIKEDKILIMLEDYFINGSVDIDFLEKTIHAMDNLNAGYVKIAAFPSKYDQQNPYTILPEYPFLGEIEKGAPYRVCLQTTLWKKSVLMQLLDKSENPWQFEIEASKRSNDYAEKFLLVVPEKNKNYVHGPIPYYCTALTKGKWMRGAIDLCKKEGVTIDTSHREVESKWEEINRAVYISLPFSLRKVYDFVRNKF